MEKITLILVDDQSIIRQGLRALLSLEEDLEILGEAANGEAAIALVEQLHPDLVLMDVRMPVLDGVAATQVICQRFPNTKILVLTTFDDDEYIAKALKAGAIGYLLKDTPSEELANAIRAAQKGYAQFGPGILPKLTAQMNPEPPRTIPPEFVALTAREKEVLRLVAEGASNREIAERLYISEGTVKNHVSNILSRLQLRDRTQAAILANSLKLFSS